MIGDIPPTPLRDFLVTAPVKGWPNTLRARAPEITTKRGRLIRTDKRRRKWNARRFRAAGPVILAPPHVAQRPHHLQVAPDRSSKYLHIGVAVQIADQGVGRAPTGRRIFAVSIDLRDRTGALGKCANLETGHVYAHQ